MSGDWKKNGALKNFDGQNGKLEPEQMNRGVHTQTLKKKIIYAN